MKAELIPDNGDPPIPINRDITVIGRREYCDIRIDHPSISKRHCILVRTAGLLILRDLASTNGTRVKGQRIRWAALLPGDRVSVGGYKVRVYLGPDDTPSPSEMHDRPSESMLVGFSPPTPPIVEPHGSSGHLPPHSATPPVEDAEIIELEQDDPIPDDDDGRWEKLPTPGGRDQFFIELD
ncbi:FHA domain-containing protein [Tautonia plasticadhaerens]|uniref:FHA domain protein n=1 Tax=Tautonia plasticadhaerens TaxID=2527974 RepID=A0A518GXR3_9BACT|nr:FHA domain-containing protein [Tautonia plasticadhaerens]QDV33380.1 FHA domain protein [Tautonia plasticadhaerens]